MPDDRRPLTAESAAEYLGCSDRYIRKLCKAGELGHFYVGRLLRIPVSAIDELQEGWAAQREAAPKEEPRERPYTAEMLAEYLGCSAQHVRNMCRAGKLQHFRYGRLLRIPADAVRELEEPRRASSENKE